MDQQNGSLIDHIGMLDAMTSSISFFLLFSMENVTSFSTGSHILWFARLFVADMKLLIFNWMHDVSSTDVSIWISNDLVIVFGNFCKLCFRRLFICILDFGWMKIWKWVSSENLVPSFLCISSGILSLHTLQSAWFFFALWQLI